MKGMTRTFWRNVIAAGVLGAFLALFLALTLAFDGGNDPLADLTSGGEVGPVGVTSEPLDEYTKNQLRETGLDFIAETGRVVTNEEGHQQIVWDSPQLPTLEESILMAERAVDANDSSLLPFCTEEYFQYLKAQKDEAAPREAPTPAPYTVAAPGFPACKAIPDQIALGPPSGPGHQ